MVSTDNSLQQLRQLLQSNRTSDINKFIFEHPDLGKAFGAWVLLLSHPSIPDIKPMLVEDSALLAIVHAVSHLRNQKPETKQFQETESKRIGKIIGMGLVATVESLEHPISHRIKSTFTYSKYWFNKYFPSICTNIEPTEKADLMSKILELAVKLNDPIVLEEIFSECIKAWPRNSTNRAEFCSVALQHVNIETPSKLTGTSLAYAVDALNYQLDSKKPRHHCTGILKRAVKAFKDEWIKMDHSKRDISPLTTADLIHIEALVTYGCWSCENKSWLETELMASAALEVHLKMRQACGRKMSSPTFEIPPDLSKQMEENENEPLTKLLLEFADAALGISIIEGSTALNKIYQLIADRDFKFANQGILLCRVYAKLFHNFSTYPPDTISFPKSLANLTHMKKDTLSYYEISEFIKYSVQGSFFNLFQWVLRAQIKPPEGVTVHDSRNNLIKECLSRWADLDWIDINKISLEELGDVVHRARLVDDGGLNINFHDLLCSTEFQKHKFFLADYESLSQLNAERHLFEVNLTKKPPFPLHAAVGKASIQFHTTLNKKSAVLSTKDPDKIATRSVVAMAELWGAQAALMKESIKRNITIDSLRSWESIFDNTDLCLRVLKLRNDLPHHYDIFELEKTNWENLVASGSGDNIIYAIEEVAEKENRSNYKRNLILHAWRKYGFYRAQDLDWYDLSRILALAYGLAVHPPKAEEQSLREEWVEDLIHKINRMPKNYRTTIKMEFEKITSNHNNDHLESIKERQSKRKNNPLVLHGSFEEKVKELTKRIVIT